MRSSRPAALLAAVAACATGVTLIVSTPAHAEQETATDVTKDVREVDYDGSNPVTKRRDRARDVVWSKASYANNKIRLWIEVRNLADENHIFIWQVQDATQRWTVRYDHEGPDPDLELTVGSSGAEAPCGGIASERYPGRERVMVVLPASCIGDPNWVRYGAGSGHIVSADRFRIDDGRRAHNWNVSTLRLGERIHES